MRVESLRLLHHFEDGLNTVIAEYTMRRVRGVRWQPVSRRSSREPGFVVRGCAAASATVAVSSGLYASVGVINTDQARLYGSAIPAVKEDGTLRCRCRHRPVQYLNNILEQDHRAIKRRVTAKQGFREFHAARRTIQGYEAMHMIRKGQVRG